MYKNVTLIAEVKISSPFGFKSTRSWQELFDLAADIGDIISIHTDYRWEGSFDNIKKARELTQKPILAKGIHDNDKDILKAISFGANYVLVVGRVPKIKQIDKCIIEPLGLKQLEDIPSGTKVVWNSRDLATGEHKLESFEQARRIWKGWLCQASNIRSVNDIKNGADAIIVGTHLYEFSKSLKSD